MLYWVLLLLLFVLFCISFCAEDYELFAPAPLCLIGFCVATVLALIGRSSWNDVDLGVEVFSIVVCGCIFFALGGLLATRTVSNRATGTRPVFKRFTSLGFQLNRIPYWRYGVVAAILVGAIVLRVYETYQLAEEYGISYSGWGDLLSAVHRETVSYLGNKNVAFDEGFSIVVRQLEKFSSAAGFVAAYLLASSLSTGLNTRDSRRGTLFALVLLFLSGAFELVKGTRMNILYYGVACVAVLGFIKLGASKNKLKTSAIIAALCGALALLASVAFFFSGDLIGRSTDSSILDYISFYYGCAMPSLQSLIDSGISTAGALGSHVFFNVYSFLSKFGIGDVGSSSIAWIPFDSYRSNVFTCFAYYFIDFGYIGVAVLSAAFGFILTFAYRQARKTANPCLVVLVGYISANTFDMARRNAFHIGALFSPNMILTLLIIVAVALFLTVNYRGGKTKTDGLQCPSEK